GGYWLRCGGSGRLAVRLRGGQVALVGAAASQGEGGARADGGDEHGAGDEQGDGTAAGRARRRRTGRDLVQCGRHGSSPRSLGDPSTPRAWGGLVKARPPDRYAPHSVRSPNGHSSWADARLGLVRWHFTVSGLGDHAV